MDEKTHLSEEGRKSLRTFLNSMIEDSAFLSGLQTVHLPLWNFEFDKNIKTLTLEDGNTAWYSGFKFTFDVDTQTIMVGANSDFCYIVGKIEALIDLLKVSQAVETAELMHENLETIKNGFYRIFIEQAPQKLKTIPYTYNKNCLDGSFDFSFKITKETVEMIVIFVSFIAANMATLSEMYDYVLGSLQLNDAALVKADISNPSTRIVH